MVFFSIQEFLSGKQESYMSLVVTYVHIEIVFAIYLYTCFLDFDCPLLYTSRRM